MTPTQAITAITAMHRAADDMRTMPDLPEVYDALDHLIWTLVQLKSKAQQIRLGIETQRRLHAWMPDMFPLKEAAE